MASMSSGTATPSARSRLTATNASYFAGETEVPADGGWSWWIHAGETIVTWNTDGAWHDVRLAGFSGMPDVVI